MNNVAVAFVFVRLLVVVEIFELVGGRSRVL